MPDTVIRKVEEWAEKGDMQEGWRFLNQNKQPYEFSNQEDDLPLINERPIKLTEIPAKFPGV